MTNQTTDARRELSEAAKEWVSQNKSGFLIYGPYQFAGHAFKAGADWQAALSTKQPRPLSEDEAVEIIRKAYINAPYGKNMGITEPLRAAYRALLAATSIKPTSEKGE